MTNTECAAVRNYGPGEVIFREGDAGNCMYSIESGTVEISSGYGTEECKRLTVLDAGSFFGEMGMVRGFLRSATAAAGGQGAVIRTITWGALSRYFKDEPAKIIMIMQQLSRRIEELTRDYIGACGEIARLLEERATLEEQLYSLEQSAGQRKPEPENAPSAVRAGHPGVTENPGTKEGAGRGKKKQEDESEKLKKYMDTYRRYMNAHSQWTFMRGGRVDLYT